jgi:hypothetical protein
MNSQVIVSSLSVVLGAFTYLKTHESFSSEWTAACSNSDNLEIEQWLQENPGLVRYQDAYEFGAFNGLVCKQTQLMNKLNDTNASALSCIIMATVAVPLLMAILLEAGRKDAGLPLRIPLAMWLMAQNFGLSVVFPLVWLPLYCFFRGTAGSIHSFRIYATLPMAIPVLILTVLVFFLDPSTPLWSHCAALLGGPAICGSSIILSVFPDPELVHDNETKKQGIASRRLSAMMYGIAGLASLALWLWMLFLMVIPTYGWSSISAVYGEVWVHAPTKLRCKTLEALALWISGLLYVGFQSKRAAFEAVGLSALFGPGAGLCMALAGVAVEDDTSIAPSVFERFLSSLKEVGDDVWSNMKEMGDNGTSSGQKQD